MLAKRRILGVDLSLGSFAEHVRAICALGKAGAGGYVCCVNAHMVVEARDPAFAAVVNGADFATADGMPVVYSLRWLEGVRQERVAGNDLMPALLAEAARQGLGVYLYGGTPAVLDAVAARAAREHAPSPVVGRESPPFRELSDAEMAEAAARIGASGAAIVLVALGCPKQERRMAALRGRVRAAMVGVGGAFALYAGADTRAPRWMRDLALEWLYRLTLEPRRLWRRYLVVNTRFIGLLAREVLSGRRGARRLTPP